MSLNKVILIGNVGKDPEIRQTQAGDSVANFSLATSESWKDRATGEKFERTEWHNIAVFSEGIVKIIQSYVKKGSKIYVEGKLQTRKWQDKDGKDRYTTEILLQSYNSKLVLLDKKPFPENHGNDSSPAVHQMIYSKAPNNAGGKTANDFSILPHDDEMPF